MHPVAAADFIINMGISLEWIVEFAAESRVSVAVLLLLDLPLPELWVHILRLPVLANAFARLVVCNGIPRLKGGLVNFHS